MGPIKEKVLDDFVADLTPAPSDHLPAQGNLFVDGSSNARGSGAGLILERPKGEKIEKCLMFDFKASNNQAE